MKIIRCFIPEVSLLLCLSTLASCGSSSSGSSTTLSAAQVAAGKVSVVATLPVNTFDQAQVASNTNTCLNTATEKDYVSAVKVSIPANPSNPAQTVTITSLQMLSTLNNWETLPIAVTLKAGSSSSWIQVGTYGNRCFSQVMVEAATNGGSTSVQVSTLLLK